MLESDEIPILLESLNWFHYCTSYTLFNRNSSY